MLRFGILLVSNFALVSDVSGSNTAHLKRKKKIYKTIREKLSVTTYNLAQSLTTSYTYCTSYILETKDKMSMLP